MTDRNRVTSLGIFGAVWLREIAGWILVGIGLAAFCVCYFGLLLQRRVVEAAGLTVIGFTVFRGGLHLLKVSMAARAAADIPLAQTPAKSAPTSRRVARSVVEYGRPPASVIPGTDGGSRK